VIVIIILATGNGICSDQEQDQDYEGGGDRSLDTQIKFSDPPGPEFGGKYGTIQAAHAMQVTLPISRIQFNLKPSKFIPNIMSMWWKEEARMRMKHPRNTPPTSATRTGGVAVRTSARSPTRMPIPATATPAIKPA
jgi:hypothetical protein